jgi:hypothetical protein
MDRVGSARMSASGAEAVSPGDRCDVAEGPILLQKSVADLCER